MSQIWVEVQWPLYSLNNSFNIGQAALGISLFCWEKVPGFIPLLFLKRIIFNVHLNSQKKMSFIVL